MAISIMCGMKDFGKTKAFVSIRPFDFASLRLSLIYNIGPKRILEPHIWGKACYATNK